MPQTNDLSKLSNVEKYKMRVAAAYGKDARPKYYKRGLTVAQGMDAKRTKTVPKGKTRKRVAAKSSIW